MFLKHSAIMSFTVLALITAVGCRAPEVRTTTDLQMDQMDQMRDGSGTHLTHMADNALLHDMAVVDFHFVPHTPELGGTGVARLDRMATFLDTYGGTVRYDTALFDEELIQRRLDNIREYLALTGCDMSRVEVKTELSGGRGDRAKILIAADDKGPVSDSSDAAATTSLVAPMGTP